MGAGVQRKVFRVEQMFGKSRMAPERPRDDPSGLARELAELRATFEQNRRELQSLQGHAGEPRMTRAAYELGAAVDGMEKAAHKIIKSTEMIDESAKTLAATMKTGYERGLAQDIQEQAMRIYETCHFQDLAGQRIGKAIAALNTIEKHVARMVALCNGDAPHVTTTVRPARSLINGPRLDGDTGHASQRDIDKMFG
jgi:chemotaxis protein CheZ